MQGAGARVLHPLFLERLQFMLAAAVLRHTATSRVLAALAAVVLEALLPQVEQVQQILVVAEAVLTRVVEVVVLVVQAVQELLFFATPAQFNISLVVQ